jgi:hypothetical protein
MSKKFPLRSIFLILRSSSENIEQLYDRRIYTQSNQTSSTPPIQTGVAWCDKEARTSREELEKQILRLV